jgi:hypothetical protein
LLYAAFFPAHRFIDAAIMGVRAAIMGWVRRL